MLDPTDYARNFDYRFFGDQFFVREMDPLEINNQIKNEFYSGKIENLRQLYKNFTSEIPDIGKQEVIQKAISSKSKN